MAEVIEERRGRVMVLTMHDPATRNALGLEIFLKAADAFHRAAHDPDVGAVVLTGSDGAFCSGGNLKNLAALNGGDPGATRTAVEHLHTWIRMMRDCPKPVIAAVEGVAAGAGVSIALACDLIVSAAEARFVLAYVKVGLSPDGGATAFLSQVMPRHLAAQLALEGDTLTAERLHALGVVNAVVPPGTALDVAVERAARLAAGPQGAQASIKTLLEDAYAGHLHAQLDREADTFTRNLHSADCAEGVRAFFDKRTPHFNR